MFHRQRHALPRVGLVPRRCVGGALKAVRRTLTLEVQASAEVRYKSGACATATTQGIDVW